MIKHTNTSHEDFTYNLNFLKTQHCRWMECTRTFHQQNVGCLLGFTLQWRHNDQDSVSNHQPHGCLLNRLFRSRSKKTSKLCVTGLCVGKSPGPMNSPHKGPVTRKMFPFDDVIMNELRHVLGVQYLCKVIRSLGNPLDYGNDVTTSPQRLF